MYKNVFLNDIVICRIRKNNNDLKKVEICRNNECQLFLNRLP